MRASSGSRSSAFQMASTMAPTMTPVRSCSRLQPSSDSSVALFVRRVTERVMLTTTTDEDMATHRPSTSATSIGCPNRVKAPAARMRGGDDLQWRGQQQRAVLAPQPAHVELDADLEEQQHHANIGEQTYELLGGTRALGQQLEAHEAYQQVADDRRQAHTPGDEPEHRGGEEDHPEFQDRDGGRLPSSKPTRSRWRSVVASVFPGPRMPGP